MLGRYLGISLMTLLIGLWIASGVYGGLLLSRTTDTAASVRLGTQEVRDALEATGADDATRADFPAGEIAGVIQASWATNVPLRPFPRGLSSESTGFVDRSRPSR